MSIHKYFYQTIRMLDRVGSYMIECDGIPCATTDKARQIVYLLLDPVMGARKPGRLF